MQQAVLPNYKRCYNTRLCPECGMRIFQLACQAHQHAQLRSTKDVVAAGTVTALASVCVLAASLLVSTLGRLMQLEAALQLSLGSDSAGVFGTDTSLAF